MLRIMKIGQFYKGKYVSRTIGKGVFEKFNSSVYVMWSKIFFFLFVKLNRVFRYIIFLFEIQKLFLHMFWLQECQLFFDFFKRM